MNMVRVNFFWGIINASKERESEKRPHLNFFEPIRGEVWSSQAPTYQGPDKKARLKGSWFSQVGFPNPLPSVCGLSDVENMVFTCNHSIWSLKALSMGRQAYRGEGYQVHLFSYSTDIACFCLATLTLTSQVATKDLLVFNTAMSFTCPVKLKSLWRTTSVTWSSLVNRI